MTGSAFFVGGTNASGAGVRSIDKVSELGSCRTPLEIPEPRKEHSAVRAGRFLVICGGLVEMDNSTLSDSSNNSNSTAPETDKFLDSRRWRMTDSCHLLDPSTGQWYQMPPVPVPVAGAAAVSVGRKIFLIGGRTEEEGPSDRVFVYDQVERGIFYGVATTRKLFNVLDGCRERRCGQRGWACPRLATPPALSVQTGSSSLPVG